MLPRRLLRTLALTLILPSICSAVEPQPCRMDDARGMCFFNDLGQISHWVVRRLDSSGNPRGPEILGYAMFRVRQMDYNDWRQKVSHLGEDEDGIERAIIDPWYAMDYTFDGDGGWRDGLLWLPYELEPYGELNRATLRVPFFKAARELLVLWEEFRQDCFEAEGADDHPVCAGTLWDMAHLGRPLAQSDFPEPSFVFGSRAVYLRKAFESSRRYEEVVQLSGLPALGGAPASAMDPGLRDKLAAEHSEVLKYLSAARNVRRQQKEQGESMK